MDKLLNSINSILDDIRSKYPKYSIHVIKRVSSALIRALADKTIPKLTDKDVDSIKRALDVVNNPYSYQTLTNLNCFNQLISELLRKKLIDSPYINTAQKVDRHLVTQLTGNLMSDVFLIQALTNDLLSLRVPDYADSVMEEIDVVCSFIASACIFGKIVFPEFHGALARLKIKDISLNPVYVNIQYNASDVFYRHFLPFPASAYFLRCLAFYRKVLCLDQISPDGVLFQFINFNQNNLDAQFGEWATARFEFLGHTPVRGMRISTFRKAVIETSAIPIVTRNQKSVYVPPFITSIHCREIKSFSLEDHHLKILGINARPLSSASIETGTKTQPPINIRTDTPLDNLLYEISIIRTSLKHRNPCTRSHRSSAADEILAFFSAWEPSLNRVDRENSKIFIDWLVSILKHGKLKPKSVNVYASLVQQFIKNLSDTGVVHELKMDVLIHVLKTTMDRYRSKKIRGSLKIFTEFIKAQYDTTFSLPNWNKDILLRKSDIPTHKPLITYEDIALAREKCHDFFTRTSGRNGTPSDINPELQALEHKADILKHAFCLAHYAGVRAGEYTDFKICNLIHDNGLTLCIRSSKTRNGIRNIPLHLLVPENYLRELTDYLFWRKAGGIGGDLLFCKPDGSRWDPKYVADEVERLFNAIGVENFTFHYLRHAFANYVLLRWFSAFHKIPAQSSLQNYELFQPEYLDKLRTLLFGGNNDRAGQDNFSYITAVIPKLMGHGGPIISLEKYVHVTDWLFYMLMETHQFERIGIRCKQAESFLQVSYPTLLGKLKGRGVKFIMPAELLELQRSRFRVDNSPIQH